MASSRTDLVALESTANKSCWSPRCLDDDPFEIECNASSSCLDFLPPGQQLIERHNPAPRDHVIEVDDVVAVKVRAQTGPRPASTK